MGGLSAYRRRRDFRKTQEPRGRVHRASRELHFVVHKHAARRLHYDLRLEYAGVLKSWAVPKGPSLDPAVRTLAIEVEDHPLEYGEFEGTIPEGEYGAGEILLWDRGRWQPLEDVERGFRKGHLKFELDGRKLKGQWQLVRMKPRDDAEKNEWLLLKSDDEFARPGSDRALLDEEPKSVKTGRDIVELRGNSRPRRPSARRTTRGRANANGATKARDIRRAIERLPNSHKSEQPQWIAPQLATLAKEPPATGSWVFEIKYDGYRIIAVRDSSGVGLWTRNRRNLADKFAPVAEAVQRLPVRRAILDGEVVVLNRSGLSDFQALQQMMQTPARPRLVYVVFDLLYCEGYDIRAAPLTERKAVLKQICDAADSGQTLQFSEHASGDGAEAMQAACDAGQEGLIFKRSDAPYVSRRTRDWFKVKCSARREFVIGGFTEPQGSRAGFGALLVGFHDNGHLRYCGRVGTGFDDATLDSMHRRLAALEQSAPPFHNPPKGAEARDVHWVRPNLVAEVGYHSMTEDGRLRHPTFQGLRLDKPPREVRSEVAIDPDQGGKATARAKAQERKTIRQSKRTTQSTRKKKSGGRTTGNSQEKSGRVIVAGVTVTHPGRVLYPQSSITKEDLARYYEAVAEYMLPHAGNRPLMLVRCPEGTAGECFHQKHISHGFPASVETVEVAEKSKRGKYPVVNRADGLVGLAQMSTLEIHGWLSRANDLERPDMVIFDLDPGEGVPWNRTVDTAFLVRDALERCGLASFVKTSGGKGLHVVVPLRPAATWTQSRDFAEALSKLITTSAPDQYVSKMTRSLRKGKIYIDYLRNGRGSTCVLPYSTRARPGAPISTPVSWRALRRLESPGEHTLATVPGRLRRTGCPWRDFDKARRVLSRQVLAKVGIDAGAKA